MHRRFMRVRHLRKFMVLVAAMPLLQFAGCAQFTDAVGIAVNTAFQEGTIGVLTAALAQIFRGVV